MVLINFLRTFAAEDRLRHGGGSGSERTMLIEGGKVRDSNVTMSFNIHLIFFIACALIVQFGIDCIGCTCFENSHAIISIYMSVAQCLIPIATCRCNYQVLIHMRV